MSTEITVSFISSVIGGLVVAIVNYAFTRKKIIAETEKLRAEAEKLRAEASKMNAEAEGIRAKTVTEFYSSLIEKDQWDLLALQLKNRPDDIKTVAERLKQDHESNIIQKLQVKRKSLETAVKRNKRKSQDSPIELDDLFTDTPESFIRELAQKAGE